MHTLLSPAPPRPATPSTASPAHHHTTVDVDNAANQEGIAAATASALTKQGYQPGTIGSSDPQPHTTVRYGSGADADARTLAAQYHTTATADPTLPPNRIHLTLGTDATPPADTTQVIPTAGAQGPPVRSTGGIPCVN